MARFLLKETALGKSGGAVRVLPGAVITATDDAAADALIYEAESGGAGAASVTSDANGTFEAWFENSSTFYTVTVTATDGATDDFRVYTPSLGDALAGGTLENVTAEDDYSRVSAGEDGVLIDAKSPTAQITIVPNRDGTLTITATYADGSVGTVEMTGDGIAMTFTDDGGEIAMMQANAGGVVGLGSSTGDVRLWNGTGSTVAPIPIDSDGAELLLRIAANGVFNRTQPDAYKSLSGASAPTNGVTAGFFRGQVFIDRGATSIYFCDTKATDPDAAATATVWKRLMFRPVFGSGAPVNGTTVAWFQYQQYWDTATLNLYIATTASTAPDTAGTGSVWVRVFWQDHSGATAPVNGTTVGWYVGQLYTALDTQRTYVCTTASTAPNTAATGSVWAPTVVS